MEWIIVRETHLEEVHLRSNKDSPDKARKILTRSLLRLRRPRRSSRPWPRNKRSSNNRE